MGVRRVSRPEITDLMPARVSLEIDGCRYVAEAAAPHARRCNGATGWLTASWFMLVTRAEERHRRTGTEIGRQHAVPSLDC
jgi:hypothetical protein